MAKRLQTLRRLYSRINRPAGLILRKRPWPPFRRSVGRAISGQNLEFAGMRVH